MTDMQKNSPQPEAQLQRAIVATLLRQKTPVSFRAEGPSMHPTIRSGDRIYVQPAGARPLRLGDIVLFRQADRLTLHRYVKRVRGDSAIGATGDAALEGLEIVAISDLCGIALSLARKGQRIPLATPHRRWLGLLRYAIRPLRRAIHTLRFAKQSQGTHSGSGQTHSHSNQNGAR